MSNLRKLQRDRVITVVNGKELVGLYFADTDGSKVLLECSPKKADRIISIWNNDLRPDEKINKVKYALQTMLCMCEDRLSILKEKDDFKDEYIRKDLGSQINHFEACEKIIKESLEVLKSL